MTILDATQAPASLDRLIDETALILDETALIHRIVFQSRLADDGIDTFTLSPDEIARQDTRSWRP